MTCEKCKFWEVHFDLDDKQISPILTEIRGKYGYCMRMDEFFAEKVIDLPFWLIDIVPHLNPPLTQGRYGQWCRTFEEGEPQ
jgi:hypothetical protein